MDGNVLREARRTEGRRCHLLGGGAKELVQPAIDRGSLWAPTKKRGRLPKPTVSVASCHGFVKIDVKSYVIHGR